MLFTLCLFSYIGDYEDKHNLTRTNSENLELASCYVKIIKHKCCDTMYHTKSTAAYLTDC